MNSWASRLFPRKVGQARTIVLNDCEDPKDTPPKRTKLAPGQQLLHLGLLSAIVAEDSITNADLLQYHSFKKECWIYYGNHGFLITGNLKTAAIKKLRVALEASKIHLLKSDDYFELIVDTG